ncbi:MAG: RluA family pseudouridine synthase [Eubacteriales bacterium]|nr:RluA family pseudouridine synthase [Eubacteriales bacterium]
MEKILQYHITENEKNFTVGQVLKKRLGLTAKEISRAKFREDGILVDGVRRRVDWRVKAGERLEVRLEKTEEAHAGLEPEEGTLAICYEDEDVIVVDKPSGILVHPAGVHYADTLANRLEAYFRKKGETVTIRPIGRLDKDTAGLVLFAKNRTAAARLSRQKETGDFQKLYLAWVEGIPDPPVGSIDVPIRKVSDSPLVMCAGMGGKAARTHYQVVERLGQTSLVQARIETGRSHQIRVHMAWLGHPLVGDPLYNPKETPPGQGTGHAALCAWRLWFLQPFTGKPVFLESAGISDFRSQIQTFRRH